MSVLAPGERAPAFELARGDGSSFTERDLEGHGSVLVFYPCAFPNVNKDISGRA